MKQVQDAYIVAATRTPIGRSHRGMFRNTRPDDLLACTLQAALRQVPGLGGPAKRSQLLAVLELARRAMAERLAERPVMDSAETLAHWLQMHLAGRALELNGNLPN